MPTAAARRPARAPTRVLALAYPLLFATVPSLDMVARNPIFYSASGTCVAALSFALLAGLAFAVAYVVLRRRLAPDSAADAAALAAFASVLLVNARARVISAISFTVFDPATALAVGIGVVAVAALAVRWTVQRAQRLRQRRRLPAPRTVSGFLTTVALLLVVRLSAGIAWQATQGAAAVRASALVRELARPIPTRADVASTAPVRHDVYILLLDEYAGAGVLRDRYGFDNRPFEDSLRALGFRVPPVVRSNYSVTLVSFASLLNFTHLTALGAELPPRERSYVPGAYLLDHNRAALFLQRRGYRVVFFPSAWYGPAQHSTVADAQDDQRTPFSAVGTLFRTALGQVVTDPTLLKSLIARIQTPQSVHAEHAAHTFAGLAALAARPRGGPPVFAEAHVVMPHQPFEVDAACRPYPRETPLAGDAPSESPAVRAALAAELGCLNGQVLATARAILARPGPRPIVVLQGDHGTQSLRPFDQFPSPPSPAQSRERFGAFGAYYLPDGGAAALPDTLSIVNVLRRVFGHYFGADLPPLPNAMYFSDWRTPYTLTEIDTLTYEAKPSAPR